MILIIEKTHARILLTYRNTPLTIKGVAPSQDVFQAKPVTRFNLLKPTFQCVNTKQVVN